MASDMLVTSSFLTQQLNKRLMVLAANLQNLLVVMFTVVPFSLRLTTKAQALVVGFYYSDHQICEGTSDVYSKPSAEH